MSLFNIYGLGIVLIIMIPNIIFAINCKGGFENIYDNKLVICLEQIGRYACMLFMIFNIPYTYFGFWFENAMSIYIAINGLLCAMYCVFWIVKSKISVVGGVLALSILPSLIFIISGIITLNIPLILASIIFSFAHITLSYKNAIITK